MLMQDTRTLNQRLALSVALGRLRGQRGDAAS